MISKRLGNVSGQLVGVIAMNVQQMLVAKTYSWCVAANQTLSGNWIVLVKATEADIPDYNHPILGDVLQFADYDSLMEWAASVA